MPRYKVTLEYDGTGFSGWQRQEEVLSVQEVFDEAVYLFSGERAESVAAGRTDAGVHAKGQVVHFDLSREMKPYSVMQGINFHLMPHPVVVTKAEPVDDEFHARFDAKRRRYLYRIINRSARLALDHSRAWRVFERLDAEAMHEAAQLLVGKHDFTSFRDTHCQAASAVKTVDRLDVIREGDEIQLHVEARSFLHHQVRIMTGSLMMIGKGMWTKQALQKALEAKDRKAAGMTAPPDGLYLVEVGY